MKRAASAAGFETEEITPGTLQLVGKVRPYWCTAVGGLLAIPTLGLSLLLLRVRKTGVSTVRLMTGVDGPRLRLSGELPEYLPRIIEHGLQEMALTPADLVDAPPVPPAPIAIPQPVSSWAPLQANGHSFASASVGPLNERTAPDEDVNATVARPRYIDLTSTSPRLKFDSGVTVTIQRHALIGRAPTATPDVPNAQLLPIADPGLSVSKTHLAVGVDEQGFWVSDRHSTNGTVITTPEGVKLTCVPGERHYVGSGWTVQMGQRSFAVTLSGRPVRQTG